MGADPNAPMADGRTSVHLAAAYGHASILEMLLRAVKLEDKEKLRYKDWNFKMTPLHFSLIYGQVQTTHGWSACFDAGCDLF